MEETDSFLFSALYLEDVASCTRMFFLGRASLLLPKWPRMSLPGIVAPAAMNPGNVCTQEMSCHFREKSESNSGRTEDLK